MVSLDSVEAAANKLKAKLVHQEKHLGKFYISIIKTSIQYAFMAWIYLYIYDMFGFEKTIVVMFIGLMLYNLRNQYADAGQQLEHDKRISALEEKKVEAK